VSCLSVVTISGLYFEVPCITSILYNTKSRLPTRCMYIYVCVVAQFVILLFLL